MSIGSIYDQRIWQLKGQKKIKGSVVYMLRADDGPVKIGSTSYIYQRLSQIQMHNHHELELIRLIRGSKCAEDWLHNYFKESWMFGEWFRFHPDMLTVKVPKDQTTPLNSTVYKELLE